MSSSPQPAASLAAEAQRQKSALLYRNAGIAWGVSVVNASLLAYVNAGMQVGVGVAWAWWGLLVAISGGRYLLARRFHARSVAPSDDTMWRRRYVVATGLTALAWALGMVVFLWHAPDGQRLFTGLVGVGMVAGAVPILAPVQAAFRIFAFPILVPVALVLLLQASSPLDWAFGFMTLIFMAALLASARYLHQTLDVSINLALEQRHLADELRASHARYHAILHHLPTGILHYDRDLVVTYCNERLTEVLQVDRAQVIGLDMKRLTDDRLLPAMKAALAGQDGSYEGEYVSTLSGVRFWVAVSCMPLQGVGDSNEGGLAIIEDISDRKRSEEEIRQLAYYDPLTRLPNRRLLMDRLGHALIASTRSKEFGVLMILDLDHFKGLNDTRGHAAGDRLLVEVAKRLSRCLRQEDTVSRLGGDEYAVMLEGLGQSEHTAATQAEAIAEKIRYALSLPYVLDGGSEHFSSTSIGLTLFRSQEETAEALLKHAEVALYRAKDAGRNTVRFFSPAMQASIEARAALEAALHRGLDKGEFCLYYQPQVGQRGNLVGAEALLRWVSPDRGLVSPAQFIPLAEESGLILLLGQWVLDQACAQLKVWSQDPRTRDLTVSANVSPRQFLQPDFVQQVRQSLFVSGADPTRLKLELTESVVLDNLETVIARMQELHSLGVGFSLDDFGTGYSSLSYLKRLPLTEIKIDQSFVRDVPGDPNDAAIVRAILAMSHSLGLDVVAEGVETESQRDFLFANGCNVYQGFLFGKPMPAVEWESILAAQVAVA